MTSQRTDQSETTTPFVGASGPLFLTQTEAAALLRISPRTLERYRVSGDGPRFCRLGSRRVVYAQDDLLAWARSGRRASTSECKA